jgi:hypothetical protein
MLGRNLTILFFLLIAVAAAYAALVAGVAP